MARFRPTFARETRRRTRKPRPVSPVTERRRARKAAAEKCRAEQRRLRTWIPDERKRVAGVIAQMQAHGRQQVTQLQAQTRELIKLERDQLTKRIKKARADAKLGRCVDVTAGPQIFQYAYPKRPPHLQRGGQQGLFAGAPIHGGGKLGDPFRVRGVQHRDEKRALAAVLAHLVHDQGGIVVLEQWNGSSYVDGPMYGLEGEGKAAKLVELDPLDPHGHNMGRAGKHPAFKAGLRHLTTQPPPPRSKYSSRPPTFDRAAALERAQAFPGMHRLPPRELEAARALVGRGSTRGIVGRATATGRDVIERARKAKKARAAGERVKRAGVKARKAKGKIRQQAFNVDGTRKPRLKNLTPPPPRPSSSTAPQPKSKKQKPRAGSLEAIEAGAARLTALKFKELPGADYPYRVFFEDGKGDRNLVAQRKTLDGAKGAAQSLALKYGQPKIYGWQVTAIKGWSNVQATSNKASDRRFWVGR